MQQDEGSTPSISTDNNNSGVRVLLVPKGMCFQRFESVYGSLVQRIEHSATNREIQVRIL